MAFTVNDYSDLVRLLAQHPEWQAELRRLILSEDLLALPAIVRDLAEAQKRSEERLAGVEDRLARLETAVAELVEAQRRTEELLKQVSRDLALLAEQVRVLVVSQQQVEITLGTHKGQLLEMKYRDHAPGYFGRWLRRAQPVSPAVVEDRLETKLSHDELLEVLQLDLVISGRLYLQPETPEVWLAVEVAAVLNEADVERALGRAALLQQAGVRALPVVAGESITLKAEDLARARKVVVVQDGRGFLWDEALAAWIPQ